MLTDSATSTALPLTTHNSPLTSSANGKPRSRQPWKPDGDAHLIYRWVKMEGKSQGWVASALNISQPTVSRVVQRYERWQAHAKDREDGRLDPAERLRAQRWLTFERNELILASCLRIANELEGFIDTSKSTILHEASRPSKEIEVRTHHARIDRTGMTARFLRLAFKINVEQLKLAEMDQPPPVPALSDEELAEEERQAAEDAEELAAAHRRSREWAKAESIDEPPAEHADQNDASASSTEYSVPSTRPDQEPTDPPAPTLNLEPGTLNSAPDQSPTHHSPAAMNNLNNLHTENSPDIAASANEPCSCVSQRCGEEKIPNTCITEVAPPQWPSDDRAVGIDRRLTAASTS